MIVVVSNQKQPIPNIPGGSVQIDLLWANIPNKPVKTHQWAVI